MKARKDVARITTRGRGPLYRTNTNDRLLVLEGFPAGDHVYGRVGDGAALQTYHRTRGRRL